MTAEVAEPCAGRAATPTAGLRRFAQRRRVPILVAGSLAGAALVALALAGRRDEFATALSNTAPWLLALAALLQLSRCS